MSTCLFCEKPPVDVHYLVITGERIVPNSYEVCEGHRGIFIKYEDVYEYDGTRKPDKPYMKYIEESVMNKWININDVLPEENEKVLTYETNARLPIKVNYISNMFTKLFSYGNTENITHWMRLPSPPDQIYISDEV